MSLDNFRVPSLEKKMIFFIISFFSGIGALFFVSPENYVLFASLLFFSLSIALVVSVLFQKKYFLILLPLFFWGMGMFMNVSTIEQVGISFFASGVLLLMHSFYTSYSEKIEISVFRDAFSAFKSGGIFLILGIVIYVFGGGNYFDNSLEREISGILIEKIMQSEEVSSLIDAQIDEQKKSAIAMCKGNKRCIDSLEKKFLSQKKEVKIQIQNEFEKNIQKYTNPETLRAFITEKNIPYLGSLSIESLQMLVFGILAFFIILPFVPLLGLIGGVFSALLFFILIFTGQISVGKKDVKKEIIY